MQRCCMQFWHSSPQMDRISPTGSKAGDRSLQSSPRFPCCGTRCVKRGEGVKLLPKNVVKLPGIESLLGRIANLPLLSDEITRWLRLGR